MPAPAIKPYRAEFSDGADFLIALIDLKLEGVKDPRLEMYSAAVGLNEGVPSEGMFLVPETFATDLWSTVYDTGQIIARCAPQPMTRGTAIKIPAIDETSRAQGSRFGGPRMYWVDEGETATASKPKYREIELQPKKLLGISYATGELAGDSRALESWLRRTFGLEASFEIEDAIVNGSGAGRPLGILNSDATITVDKESGQTAATVVAANFENMIARVWGPSRRNAVWLLNNDVLKQAEPLSQSNGKPLVDYDANGNPRIMGRPALLTEYTPAIGARGDVVLADFSQYLISEVAPGFLSSIFLRFLFDEMAFKFRYRVDGQSAWRSPITPKNSSTTQSPFVTLAARA